MCFDAVLGCLLGSVMLTLSTISNVRLRLKLAAGLGEPWTRDGWYSAGLSSEHDV